MWDDWKHEHKVTNVLNNAITDIMYRQWKCCSGKDMYHQTAKCKCYKCLSIQIQNLLNSIRFYLYSFAEISLSELFASVTKL